MIPQVWKSEDQNQRVRVQVRVSVPVRLVPSEGSGEELPGPFPASRSCYIPWLLVSSSMFKASSRHFPPAPLVSAAVITSLSSPSLSPWPPSFLPWDCVGSQLLQAYPLGPILQSPFVMSGYRFQGLNILGEGTVTLSTTLMSPWNF